MLQVIALVIAIGLVYAIKAVCIMRRHEQLVGQAASFSWMRPRTSEDVRASAEAASEELSSQVEAHAPVAVPRVLSHA